MDARWGQAAVYVPSPPTLIVQGGKTDPSSSYTYSNAPNSPDTLLLPLDSSFDAQSPPWSKLSTPGPPYAFHSLSLLPTNGDAFDFLSFGGDAGSAEATQTQANSAWVGSMTDGKVDYEHEASGWGDQPMRRLYHSTAASPGSDLVYFTGGLKGDGSGAIFNDFFAFDHLSSTFTSLPTLPRGIFHHASALLPNGTLIVVGGASRSEQTGNAAVDPLSSILVFDTTSSSSGWDERALGGQLPSGRRGASLVLDQKGDKAFVFGGASSAVDQAYGDGWELDLQSCTWTQVAEDTQGPGPRFDHSAIAVGGDQVLVFGGYSADRPASNELYVWNQATNSWATSFTLTVVPASVTQSAAASSPVPTGSIVQTLSDGAVVVSATNGLETIASGFSPSSAIQQSSSIDTASSAASSSSEASEASEASASGSNELLSTPARIGIGIGAAALAGMIVGALIYRYRRKKRRQALLGAAAWNGPGGNGGARPYGSREKGGEGLMEQGREKEIPGTTPDLPEKEMSVKSPILGLGMGAIGASLASISSKFKARRVSGQQDPYARLDDAEAYNDHLGGPVRRSTRKVGSGIRLVGPRSPKASTLRSKYAPVRGSTSRNVPIEASPDSRIDILHDEDSRDFNTIHEEDWAISHEEDDPDNWRSANTILQREKRSRARGPFDAESDTESEDDDDGQGGVMMSYSPLRGGPVPTPRLSRADLDPFNDPNVVAKGDTRRYSEYHSPFDQSDVSGLMPPGPSKRYSDTSIPRSARSGASGYTGSSVEHEEATVQYAQIVTSHSASIVSPVESSYVPIKRSESFFKRMAAGGITSLLSRQSIKSQVAVLDVRDPNPAPGLWPIESRDELSSPIVEPRHPPSAYKGTGDLSAGLNGAHDRGPSVSSLQSARSMRDMVIVQREPSSSSTEEIGLVDDNPFTDGQNVGHHRHGLTALSESSSSIAPNHLGGETPGSIVFDGGAFAASPSLDLDFGPNPVLPLSSAIPTPLSPLEEDEPTPKKATSRGDTEAIIAPVTSLGTPTRRPEPPSGSPVPSPLVQHRRPVREVVESINKRGGGIPLAFTSSPASTYSTNSSLPPSPASTKSSMTPLPGRLRGFERFEKVDKRDSSSSNRSGGRPSTMYEAVKRERLLVANPDAGGLGLSRKNSD